MTSYAVTYRRTALDEAVLRLRTVLTIANGAHPALTTTPTYMPTPDEARVLADAADAEAARISGGPHAVALCCVVAALEGHARSTRNAADALDRALAAAAPVLVGAA